MARTWLLGIVAVAACGGHRVEVAPSPSPEAAIDAFMAAVAEKNVARMAQFWGNANGSAAETGQPPDYSKRMDIMLAYLQGTSYKIVGGAASSQAGSRANGLDTLRVEVSRPQCSAQLPFALVRTRTQRWVIQSFDLAVVGGLSRPCAGKIP